MPFRTVVAKTRAPRRIALGLSLLLTVSEDGQEVRLENTLLVPL